MRGGKRTGSGAKKKKDTLDSSITFRIRSVVKNELKSIYGKGLNKMFLEWSVEITNKNKLGL